MTPTSNSSSFDFNAAVSAAQLWFAEGTANGAPIFRTDAEGLYEAYLTALPEHERQTHTCRACQDFIRSYGGLVTITPNGHTSPAVWPADAPGGYGTAVNAVREIVSKARVSGVFLSSAPTLGKPVTGAWTHFAIASPTRYSGIIKTAGQTMAEKTEDFRILMAALQDFPLEAVEQAVAVLGAEALYRSEKVQGVARWLQDLHTRRAATKNVRLQENLTWLAVATAPPGFCHVRSTMIGTLLEDIIGGLPFEAIRSRFAEKMNPLQYQRPQAAPSAGNIAQAEKIVQQLGIASALRRRFARVDEVEAIWRPAELQQSAASEEGSVFGHLKPKEPAAAIRPLEIPPQTITWLKFLEAVLPDAAKIELRVPLNGNFVALVTAVDPEAPPILQWDSLERRNPVSWYLYHHGSPASNWGLTPGPVPVTAICYQTSAWYESRITHQSHGVTFLLKGAADQRTGQGIGLFPECLKSELHAVRATIEAYSKGAELEGREQASACGYIIQKGPGNWDCVLSVSTRAGNVAIYKLDRWD